MWPLLVVSQVSYYRYTAYYCFCKWVTRHATLDGKRSSLLLWILNDCSRGHLSSPRSIRHFFLSKARKKEKKALQYLRERPAVVGVWTPQQQFLNVLNGWLITYFITTLCSFVLGLWNTWPDTHACKLLHFDEESIHKIQGVICAANLL